MFNGWPTSKLHENDFIRGNSLANENKGLKHAEIHPVLFVIVNHIWNDIIIIGSKVHFIDFFLKNISGSINFIFVKQTLIWQVL